jgi:hypothetical protein
MKTLILNILLILSTSQLFSQQSTEDAIAGSWKVVDSKINLKLAPDLNEKMDSSQQKQMEQMRLSFIGTIFSFKADSEFTIEFTGKYPEFTKGLEFLNHKKWKVISGTIVAIGSKEDNYSLMKIVTGSNQGKNYFILNESPFVLEVVKQ